MDIRQKSASISAGSVTADSRDNPRPNLLRQREAIPPCPSIHFYPHLKKSKSNAKESRDSSLSMAERRDSKLAKEKESPSPTGPSEEELKDYMRKNPAVVKQAQKMAAHEAVPPCPSFHSFPHMTRGESRDGHKGPVAMIKEIKNTIVKKVHS